MSDEAEIQRIETFLDSANGPLSEADIAAGTGISIDETGRLLRQIMLRYECTLDVREDGAIVYDFGRNLRRIGVPTPRERLRAIGTRLWTLFQKLYRFTLAATLVLYAVIFVVLLMAAAVTAAFSTRDEEAGVRGYRASAAIFRAVLEFATHSAIIYADVDAYGYRHKHFESRQSALRGTAKEPKKSFIASVYDFVFGPARVAIQDGAQERELAAFVRQSEGVLTVSDVQALSGRSRAASEKLFAQFVARFDGDAIVADNGALIARFETLMQSASDAHDAPVLYFWDEYEPPYELTGNTTGRNIAVGGLALFNIAGAIAMLTTSEIPALVSWLGVIPLVVFTLFLIIPAARALWIRRKNKEQHETNIRKRLYKEIFRGDEATLSFANIVEWANHNRTTEEQLSVAEIRPLLESTSYELGGSFDMNEADALYMDTDVLRREQTAKQGVAVAVEPAHAVVFSTVEDA